MARDWRYGWQLDYQDRTEYREWTEAFEFHQGMECFVVAKAWTPVGQPWLHEQVLRFVREVGVLWVQSRPSGGRARGYHLLDGGLSHQSRRLAVEGVKTLRYLCYRLGTTQPPQFYSEDHVPTREELEEEIAAAKAERERKAVQGEQEWREYLERSRCWGPAKW